MRHLATAALTLCCVWAAAACGDDGDDPSRQDDRRSAAKPMDMGGIADDKVDPAAGDSTDWKKFSLVTDDTVTVTVYFDNPTVDAKVALRDAFGSDLKKCVKEADKDCVLTIDLKGGTYFVGVEAGEQASVYTVSVELGSGKIAGTGGYDDPRPE